ncbi:MAG: sulfatase-like hydrolase/transferase [Acidobacteriota bacterium]|nr:sulfatase-like hydrolase/transferase [Acidobacteriota bacterium]
MKSKSRGRSRSSSPKPRRQTEPAQATPAPAPPHARPLFIVGVAVVALVAIVVIGVVTWRTIGADTAPPIVTGAFKGDNVLLVTIDTLRRDRLGVYGDRDGLTPNLDRLANTGIRFDDAFSEVPETLPAHTSIMTGLTPRSHGIHNNGTFGLGKGPATMASLFKQAGYRTGAFVAAFVLDARFGLNRGFDHYDDYYGLQQSPSSFYIVERTAPEVLAPALAWIDGSPSPDAAPTDLPGSRVAPASGAAHAGDPGKKQPWFAWVHLFDCHAPYHAPQEFRQGRTPYDSEVAYTDAMLGRFLDELRNRGELAHTVIIVTADHGESLGDHGEQTHGLFAYNSTLKIPLIVWAPGIRPEVNKRLVADIDILPTALDLTGVPVPAGLDGHSLVPAMNGTAPKTAPPVYFEALDANLTRGWAPLTGVIAGNWKYIDLPIPELYNLAKDPDESHNLASTDGEKMRELEALLKEIKAAPVRPGNAPTRVESADAEARLRSLGYVSGDEPGKKIYTDADDPKNLVALNNLFTSALEESSTGQIKEALQQLDTVLAQRPDFQTARTSAADILLSQGRAADAISLLKAAPGGVDHSPELLAKLGAAEREAGDLAAASKTLEQAIAQGSLDPDVYNDLGVIYAEMGRLDDARGMFNRLLALDPSAPGAWNNLGILAMNAHDSTAAARDFRKAIESDPSYGEAWHGLGAALVDRDPGGAVDAWRHAVELMPGNYDLLYNLGIVLSRSSQPRMALPYLNRFVQQAPPQQYAPDIATVKALIARIEQSAGR